MFHLYHPSCFCSRCFGNNRSSCSSCIDRWRPWRYPCYAAVVGLVVGWVSIAPCHVRSHPQPPPLSLCLRNPWAWLHKIQAANHGSPLVSHAYWTVLLTAFSNWYFRYLVSCLEVKMKYNCNFSASNLPADVCCTHLSLPNFCLGIKESKTCGCYPKKCFNYFCYWVFKPTAWL